MTHHASHTRRGTLSLLALPLLLAALWAHAQAATYYVSTSGSDSNSCAVATQGGSHAKRHLKSGCACLQGGDTLLVDDGVYPEQIATMVSSENPDPCIPPSGPSRTQRTTIKAVHPRQATLNKPAAGPPVNRVVTLDSRDNVAIDGFVIDGRGHGMCVWLGPGSGHLLHNNRIQNCGSNGVYVSVSDAGTGGSYMELLGNEISAIGSEELGPPGAHAIYFTGNQSRIAGNYIHAPCPFYGIHPTSELGGLYHNLIENNRVVGCDQAGIISQGAETVIRNNLLENNCIGIMLTNHSTEVAHNTIYGWHHGPYCGDSYGIFDKTGGSTLSNNLIVQQRDVSSFPRYIYATGAPHLQQNLCDGLHPQRCQVTVAPSTPVVVDGPGGNLHLVPGSPAIDAGAPLPEMTTDYDGGTRPQGAALDIGAYEYGATPVPPEPGPEPVPPHPPSSVTLTYPAVTLPAMHCTGTPDASGVIALSCTPQADTRR